MPDHARREVIIVQLLERLAELTDPMRAGNGDGQIGYLRMPSTYADCDSVREVERLVVRLREERHHLWWHLNERYLNAVTVTMWRCPKCGGHTHAPTHRHRDKRNRMSDYHGMRVLVVRWSPRVDPRKVKLAVEWIAEQWALQHEPFLPRELMVA